MRWVTLAIVGAACAAEVVTYLLFRNVVLSIGAFAGVLVAGFLYARPKDEVDQLLKKLEADEPAPPARARSEPEPQPPSQPEWSYQALRLTTALDDVRAEYEARQRQLESVVAPAVAELRSFAEDARRAEEDRDRAMQLRLDRMTRAFDARARAADARLAAALAQMRAELADDMARALDEILLQNAHRERRAGQQERDVRR